MSADAVLEPQTLAGNQRPKKPRSVRRKLVWVVGIVVVGLMAIAVLLPSLCRAREPANRVKCASNLRQIGQGIVEYGQSHGGAFPPSLAVLPAEVDMTAEVMICPSSSDEKSQAADTAGIVADLNAAEVNADGHKHCLSYVYVGRELTTTTATDKTIVAYEPLANHDEDGLNVLFGDGHVEFISARDWHSVAAHGGVTLPPTTRDAM